MNRTSSFCFILCILAATSMYGQEWEYSITPYDIRVYVNNYDTSRVIASTLSYVDNNYLPSLVESDTVYTLSNRGYLWGGSEKEVEIPDLLGQSRERNHGSMVYLHPFGLIVSQYYYMRANHILPLFLTQPIPEDSVLDLTDTLGTLIKDCRTLDTTIYGQSYHAFAYTQCLYKDTVTVVVASPIGIVRIIDPKSAKEWYLSSAVVDGQDINRDQRVFRNLRPCDDFKARVLHHKEMAGTFDWTCELADTLINGVWYKYFIDGHHSQNYNFPLYYEQISNIFRYSGDSLLFFDEGVERLLVDTPVSLGTVVDMLPYGIPEAGFVWFVVDTGSVRLNSELKRTIKMAHFGGGADLEVESWVEDYGLLYRDVLYNGGSEHEQLVSVVNCGVEVEGLDKFRRDIRWDMPKYHSGDILVYEQKQGNGRALHRFGPVSRDVLPNTNDIDTVGLMSHFKIESGGALPPAEVGWEPWTNTPGMSAVYMNDDGVLMKLQDGGSAVYPWFVMGPPVADSIVVRDSVGHGSEVHVYTDFIVFDTLVFGNYLDAVRYREAGSGRTIVVAERFGVVRVTEDGCPDCDWSLSSAVIDGVYYNYALRPVAMPHVCSNLVAEYEVKTQEGAISTAIQTADDTLINGMQYMIYPLFGYSIFRYQDTDVIAHINGKDTLVTPPQISLGTLISEDYMVTDTFSVLMNDGIHFGFSYGWYGNDYASWTKWLDGIGKYEVASWAWSIGTGYTRLRRLTTCNKDYIVTSTETVPPAAPSSPRLFSSPYPNPVSLGQGSVTLTSTQQLTQPVDIVLSDVLGRKVCTLRLEPTGPGTALRIPLRNIGPGLYYLSIHGATFSETTKLVVVK